MSDKLREAAKELLVHAEAVPVWWTHAQESIRKLREALADDDAARGTMREEFEAWCVRNGYPTDYTPGAECGVEGGPVYRDTRTHAAWWAYREGQASRAAAPQSVEPACRDDGRCQYAIDHGAEGLGHCPKGKCAMPSAPAASQPIDMVLHCPACGMQHIDAPERGVLVSGGPNAGRVRAGWSNPPHRSHLCHSCGHIWRPADVPTNGIQAVATKGKNDSPINAAAPQSVEAVAEVTADELVTLVGEDIAPMIDAGTLAHTLGDTQSTVCEVTARDIAVARALLFCVSGSALLNGDKKAIIDASTLYRMACIANNLLIGRLTPPSAPTDAEYVAEGMRLHEFVKHHTLEADNFSRGDEKYLAHLDHARIGTEALRAHLSTRPAQAEGWIACSERLPNPDFGEVLVWLWESKMYAIDEWHTYREDPTGMGGPTLDMGLMWRNFDFDEVSHWRPLPAPPSALSSPNSTPCAQGARRLRRCWWQRNVVGPIGLAPNCLTASTPT